jgi:hypothetical protein
MTNYFNFKRFLLWVKLIVFEKRWPLLGVWISMLFLSFLLYSSIMPRKGIQFEPEFAQFLSLCLFLIVGPSICLYFLFSDFIHKKGLIKNLLNPASYIEKWLSVIFVIFLIIIPLFLVSLKSLDYCFLSNLKIHQKRMMTEESSFINFNLFNPDNLHYRFSIFPFLIIGFFGIGLTFFKRLVVLKSLILTILLFLFIAYTKEFLISAGMGFVKIKVPFLSFDSIILKEINFSEMPLRLPNNLGKIMTLFHTAVLPVVLWIVILFRFKEKEV